MAADGQVSLEIQVLADKASQSVAQFQKDTAAAVQGINEKLESMKTLAEAAVVAFAVEHIAEFFKTTIEAASKQEDAINRLNTALGVSGDYSAGASADLQEFADQMQATTRFSNDAVISQLAIAKAFGASNDGAKDLVSAASELATATGTTLDEAVSKLGKTYSGEAGRLGQMLPALKDLTAEQLKSGAAIDYILKRFGGSAAADVDTFTGSIAQLSNAYEDISKARGTVIIQDPLVIAGIHALTELFQENTEQAKANGDAFRSFVDGVVKSVAVGIPVALDVLAFFARGFEGAVSVIALAAQGVVQVVNGLVTVVVGGLSGAIDSMLGLTETVLRAAASVPGLESSFKAMGLSATHAADGIGDLRTSITSNLDEAVATVGDFTDSFGEGVAASIGKVEDFDTSLNGFRAGVDKVAQAVFDADGQTIKSAKEVTNSRKDLAAAAGLTADQLADLAKQAEDFAHQVFTAGLSDAAKVDQSRREQLEKLQDFEKQGAIATQDAALARQQIEAQAADKITEIREKAAKAAAKADEDAANAADKLADDWAKETDDAIKKAARAAQEARSAVESAANSPITFAFSFADIQPADLDPLTQQIAGSAVGLLGKVLQGAAGAKDLIAQGAGAFADAFLPGIGPAVSGVIGQLAQGPEATEKFIREFIAAVPQIMDAVAESIPAVVDALVDTLIDKGGIVKIGIALTKAMFGITTLEAAGKMLGKQMGLEFGSAFNSSNIGQTIMEGMHAAGGWLEDVPTKIGEAFSKGVSDFADGLQRGGDAIRIALAAAPAQIIDGFKEGLAAVRDAITGSLTSGASLLTKAITDTANLVGPILKSFFSGFVNAFGDLLKPLFKFPELPHFSWPTLPTFKWPEIPTPSWLKSLGGGGGGGGFSIPGLASGGTIPSGFANDGLLAHVGTGELVVPQDDVTMLRSFLVKQDSGDGGIGNDGVMALLARIAASLEGNQSAQVTLQIDSQTLADQMVSLSRRNARLRA